MNEGDGGRSVVVPAPVVAADGAAAERVGEHEEQQDGDVERGHGLPVVDGGGHHGGLARVAPEAQHPRVVAPRPAVHGARRRGRAGRRRPERRVHALEPAVRRRLAAPGLHQKKNGKGYLSSCCHFVWAHRRVCMPWKVERNQRIRRRVRGVPERAAGTAGRTRRR